MVLNDFEYGAILQKIKVIMPQAEEDQMYDLTDGQAIDHYVVAKPQVDQKLFVTRTPYQFHITIQRETLKEAFLSESASSGFAAFCNSAKIFSTRIPLGPIQEPIQSTFSSLEYTAILVLEPASLETPLTITTPSAISGISSSNILRTKPE